MGAKSEIATKKRSEEQSQRVAELRRCEAETADSSTAYEVWRNRIERCWCDE